MAFRYSVFSGYSFWEKEDTRFDGIDNNHLAIRNESGRRAGFLDWGIDLDTYQDYVRHTYVQSKEDVFNQTTFSTWFWFNSDGPISDSVLLGRFYEMNPIWAIRTVSGCIAFETGDGIGGAQSIIGPPVTQGDHFVGVTYDDTTGEKVLYYDGLIVATGESNIMMPTNLVGITYSSPILPFNGYETTALWTELILEATDFDLIWNNGNGRYMIWYFDLSKLGLIKCIFRNKIIQLNRQEIEELYREKIRILEAKKHVQQPRI